MKKFFKVLLKILMAIVIILITITMICISINSEKIPDASISSANAQAVLVKGNYNWKAFTQVLKQENYEYTFKNENTILVSPGEVLTISTSEQVGTRRLFEIKRIYYMDGEGNTNVSSTIPQETPIGSYSNRYIEQLIAPDKEGTYYYYAKFSFFEKGEVDYAFKVVVSVEPNYDISELIKLNKTSLLDYDGIQNIINILPYAKDITNITICSSSTPTRLIIHYNEFKTDRNQYNNNVIALFSLVPELDIVEYIASDNYYCFTRDEMEFLQGRDLEEYTSNMELWESEVLYKERQDDNYVSLDKAIYSLIKSALEFESGDKIDFMSIDNRFFSTIADGEDVDLITRKVYNLLANYSKSIINIDYDSYKEQNHTEPYIRVQSISYFTEPSGDENLSSGDQKTVDEDLHNLEISVFKDKKETIKKYELNRVGEDWIIREVD